VSISNIYEISSVDGISKVAPSRAITTAHCNVRAANLGRTAFSRRFAPESQELARNLLNAPSVSRSRVLVAALPAVPTAAVVCPPVGDLRYLLSPVNRLDIAIDHAVAKDADAVRFFIGESL